MDAPKIIRIVEYNNKVFRVGDIVDYTLDTGFSEKTGTGRLKRVGEKNIELDTSKTIDGRIETHNIENLKSISHAAMLILCDDCSKKYRTAEQEE